MHIDEALKIIDEADMIVERKKVSEMTPEEYQADLEARRKRRELRKQRTAEQPEKSKSDEELRRQNSEQIAKGYEDAEREIKKKLSDMRNNFEFFSDLYAGDKKKFARTAAKSLTSIKDKLESGNLLSDIRTSMDASKLLDDIQRKITEIKAFIRAGRKSLYMDPFRYIEITFVDHTSTGNRYNATPNNDGRPMDEWGQPLRVYIWDLPDQFDSRNAKVSKSQFIKWLSRLKMKYSGKYKSGTRRNKITWDTYDIWADKYKLYGKDWEYKHTIAFEDIYGTIEISHIRTNTGETLV
jgi:hypothetical protein